MLPSSGELELDYLDLLDNYWVVDHTTLTSKSTRHAEAERILDDMAPERPMT